MRLGRSVNIPGLQNVCRYCSALGFLIKGFGEIRKTILSNMQKGTVCVSAELPWNDRKIRGACMVLSVVVATRHITVWWPPAPYWWCFSLFAPQDVTCALITATASAPCMGPSTPCAVWWAPAVLLQQPLHLRSQSGSGTCPGKCACAPAQCLAWPTAFVRHSGSNRAPGLGPSRESSSCQRRFKPEPSGTLSISGK